MPCSCPTQAIFYGTYEEWLAAGRGAQGAKPVNRFYFGRQRVRTRNCVVLTEEDEALDLLALLDEVSLGLGQETPAATASRNAADWVDARMAGIPEWEAPAQPWTPREPVPAPVSVSQASH
uniref:Uncharacterized protein n=1 Tax=Thermogemmatispora argillosa TaxID=2045280 RepID=A0A455SUI2_9CHLR|nr:hypothetical protein KTA_02820 [Thermogemmatispora argillosa]